LFPENTPRILRELFTAGLDLGHLSGVGAPRPTAGGHRRHSRQQLRTRPRLGVSEGKTTHRKTCTPGGAGCCACARSLVCAAPS